MKYNIIISKEYNEEELNNDATFTQDLKIGFIIDKHCPYNYFFPYGMHDEDIVVSIETVKNFKKRGGLNLKYNIKGDLI